MKLIPKFQTGGMMKPLTPKGLPNQTFNINTKPFLSIGSGDQISASYGFTPYWSTITPRTLGHNYQKLGLIPKGQSLSTFIKGVSQNPASLPKSDQFRFNPDLNKFETSIYGGSYQTTQQDVENMKKLGKHLPSGRYTNAWEYMGQVKKLGGIIPSWNTITK